MLTRSCTTWWCCDLPAEAFADVVFAMEAFDVLKLALASYPSQVSSPKDQVESAVCVIVVIVVDVVHVYMWSQSSLIARSSMPYRRLSIPSSGTSLH